MTVYNVLISPDQIEACIARMKQGPFVAADIVKAAEAAGVPERCGYYSGIQYRAADRIIQQQRAKGNLSYSQKRVWNWIGVNKPKS